MKKVWKVTTELTEDENRKLMSSMSEEEHQLMMNLELDLSVDVLEDDKVTSFVICNELNLEKLKSLLMNHNVIFTAFIYIVYVICQPFKIKSDFIRT